MNYYSVSRLIGSSDAAELICSLTGKSREWLMLNRDWELPGKVADAARLVSSGTPLQYITGKAYFYGDRYFVSPDVLIPQPDTEHVVEAALSLLSPGQFLVDLCTGSGCIAISILKRRLIKAEAVDVSAPALGVARKNAELHKVLGRLKLTQLNVLTEDLSSLFAAADVITANPPYINSDLIDSLPADVQSEPRTALDGGSDGMDFYRRFMSFTTYMKPDAALVFEIGYDQAARITALASEYSLHTQIKRDFGNNDRVAVITK